MAGFVSLLDSARLLLGDWLKILTANLEFWVVFAALFIIWLWPPLHRRFWIRIKVHCPDARSRRPGVQSYLPDEVTEHIDSVKRLGVVWNAIWTAVTFAICAIFAVVLSLSVFQQGIALRGLSTAAYTAFFAIVAVFLPLAAGTFVCIATWWLWILAPLYIERERGRWIALRKKECVYFNGFDGWKGWAGWELEDEKLLKQRNPALRAGDDITAWDMLEASELEKSFWNILMKRRVPHIYQLVILTPNGTKDHRRLDFALLDPKTGEPVLGIETDEWHHFVDKDLQEKLCGNCRRNPIFMKNAPDEDFGRELDIWNAVGIPIHRIPGAYWFRGLAPNDTKRPEKIKKNQQRLLKAALRERDRVIRDSIVKTKQKQIQKEKR